MSFLDTVVMPANSTPSVPVQNKTGSSFLNTVIMPPANYIPPVAPVQTPKPSFMDNVISGIKDYAQKSADTVLTVGRNLLNPTGIPKNIEKTYNEPLNQSLDQAKSSVDAMISDYQNHTGSTAGDVSNLLNLALGVGGAVFSPISGVFNVAEKIPGAKQVADAVNLPFQALGKVGSYTFGKAIDLTPTSILSQETKDIIKPAVQNVGSFAAQILLGNTIMDKISALHENGTEVTPEVAKKVIVQSTDEINKVNVSTPNSKHAEYMKSQGYEPYISHEQLPTIDYGNRPKDSSGLPTIQTETPVSTKVGNMTVEPIKGIQNAQVKGGFLESVAKPTENTQNPSILTENQQKIVENNAKSKEVLPLEAANGTKISGVASSIEAKSIEKGLTDSLGGLAGYDPITIKEQAQMASDLITNNIESAKNMVKGVEPLPSKLRGAALIKGLEDYATQKGDISLLQDLANSPLVSETSRHAQELRLLAERSPDSPIKMMQDVKSARESVIEKTSGKKVAKVKADVVTEIQTEMRKIVQTKQTWSDFIEQIKCNY